jgi:hypothetical protein
MFIPKINEVWPSNKSFITDPICGINFGVSALLNIIHWAILYSKIGVDQNKLVLHYSAIYGPDVVNKGIYLYLIPIIALVFFLINFFLAGYFYKKEKLAAYFLAAATIAVQVVLFVAAFALILVNE